VAPKKKVTEEKDSSQSDVDPAKILKTLKDSFNKDKGDDDYVAWNLSVDENPTSVKEFISTGSTLLDYIVSNRRNGGIPVGKITEIQGEEASGKSLIAAHIIANVQAKGGVAVYIDTENAMNPEFAKQVGVDLSKVLYLQPGTIEACFEAIEKCITFVRTKNSNALFVIIWDSIAATPPQAEIEGDYDPNSRIGLMAKALAKGMRKLTNTFGKERVTMVFTNQLKMRPGVMYGDPFVTPGGKAIPYHASARIRLSSSTKLKDQKTNEVFGIKTNGKIVKTRLGPPHRSCTFQIHFSSGIDDVGSWRDFLHERKIIEKRAGYMIMENVPGEDVIDQKTGEIKPGEDIAELKFRESEWNTLIETRPMFKEYVLSLLEKLMIVAYDSKAPQVDSDSIIEEVSDHDE
jgi:recombination protein RecA